MADRTTKKKIVCYGCGRKSTKTFNITKNKWSRAFNCPKCGSRSFQWYNF